MRTPFFDPKPTPWGGLNAPATERNRGPIVDVLRRVLPPRGLVLEIASGTGQHVAYFAECFPALRWQPSDIKPANLDSIRAWMAHQGLGNLEPPVSLDVAQQPWPVAHADAIVCINMIHIAPWSATKALLRGTARLLSKGGPLYLYGPFKRNGAHTAPSNQRFDESLRSDDPQWGVRDLEEVQQLAVAAGFGLAEIVAMPANNLSVIFRCDEASPQTAAHRQSMD